MQTTGPVRGGDQLRENEETVTAVSNGLLLRRDVHSLFDAGYVTVTPSRHFEVSRRIKEEFDNGRHYYDLHRRPIEPPDRPQHSPDPVELAWHNEHRFLG